MLKKKKLPVQVCSRPMDPAADASAELGWKNNSRKLLQKGKLEDRDKLPPPPKGAY